MPCGPTARERKSLTIWKHTSNSWRGNKMPVSTLFSVGVDTLLQAGPALRPRGFCISARA